MTETPITPDALEAEIEALKMILSHPYTDHLAWVHANERFEELNKQLRELTKTEDDE